MILVWKKIKVYAIAIAIPLAVGGLSAFLSRGGMDAYQLVIQPPLSPPMWLFPVVWSLLYILMGIGSGIVWLRRENDPEATLSALIVYGFQLVVNFFWSIIFFNMQAFLFAFIWLALLWLLIIAMIVKFSRISRAAAWLQVPYLLWVTFAGYLTLMVWLLNR
ncbi:MAG: tryptophan-rich sensory protein [Clostridia bacterium]|nr:tryptophan-rich sensory protein [Clostridia bacterium]